jgi:hypothetical protein
VRTGLLLALTLAVAPAVPVLVPSAAQAGCAPVQVLAFRGSGEAAGPDGAGWTLQPALDAARAAAPGAFAVVGVPYLATGPQDLISDPALLRPSVDDGVAKGLAAIRGCPGSRFVLAGYSQGMIVAHELAIAAPAGTVAGLFGFGDPDQVPDGRGVTGTGAAGQGAYRWYAGTGGDAVYGMPIGIWTLCHGGDPVCQFTVAAAMAGDFSQHTYDAFVAEQQAAGVALAGLARAAGSSSVSTPVAGLQTPKLRLTRVAAGSLKGTVLGVGYPAGVAVQVQGRSDRNHPWRTLAKASVRRGAFSMKWRAGVTSKQVRVVLAATPGWRSVTATAPPPPRRR